MDSQEKGNLLLFVLLILAQPHLKKPIDSIIVHLTLVNTMNIVFTLTPYITSSFGVRNLLNDAGCKAVLYINRVTRGLSICTTSLLSTFQAITISPINSKWAWLKSKLTLSIFPLLLFYWIINMLVYIHIIETVRARGNVTFVGRGYTDVYCQTRKVLNTPVGTFISVILIRDLLFVFLMIWTSLYMVSLLFRHHRRAQHIHRPRLSSQLSPEHKATHSILLLVTCFVFFYCSNNILTIYSFYSPEKIIMFEVITVLLSSCYPAISPILLRNNKIISQFTSSKGPGATQSFGMLLHIYVIKVEGKRSQEFYEKSKSPTCDRA
ncbi:LOW QUALITY PROTEIN: vomeronasal type-1 receptor 4-like [Ctenodactylus gundi]